MNIDKKPSVSSSLHRDLRNRVRAAQIKLIIVDAFYCLLLIFFILLGWTERFGFNIGASVSFDLALSLAYLTTIRPRLMKPDVLLWAESRPPWSPNNIVDNDQGSWYLRIVVANCGLVPARNCVGRLIGVWQKQGVSVKKFDPMNLYWPRQTTPSNYHAVNIQGHGDFEYLDVAKITKYLQDPPPPLYLRVVIDSRLATFPQDDPSPGHEPWLKAGSYFILVGLYSDEVSIGKCWFKIGCSNIEQHHNDSNSAPCFIMKENPRWASEVI